MTVGAFASVAMAAFATVAAYCCFYAALVKHQISAQGRHAQLWLAGLLGCGTALMISADSWTGCGLAWGVTLACAKPYYSARFQGVHCECYGEDHYFLPHTFPWLLSLGLLATLLSYESSALDALPSAKTAVASAGWLVLTASLVWRTTVKMGAPLQPQPYRTGKIRSVPLESATVLFWGSVACAPCANASSELISMLQAFPDRAQAAMALEGYPNDAPRRFKGVSVVTVAEMFAVVPFEQTPSLALIDASGRYMLFEGLANIRVGLGYLLRGI